MRHYILMMAVLLAVAATASPIDYKRRLINRPSIPEVFNRQRRAEPLKGVKGRVPLTKIEQPIQLRLRKGEYVCGDKVCKLRPGEIPPNCHGCQYPI